MEAGEGWSAGSDPGNGSKAMKKTNGLKEVDVYRSSHTNSCFNKWIREGNVHILHMCSNCPFMLAAVMRRVHVGKMEMNGSTPWRGVRGAKNGIIVEKTHFYNIVSPSVLRNRRSM